MKFTHVKKGDTVKVLAGKEKGKTGVISKSMPSEGKVVKIKSDESQILFFL